MTKRQWKKELAKRRAAKRKVKAAPKKALAAWSQEVRSEGVCCVPGCGATDNLQAHHILPKERYPEFKTHLTNGVVLCPLHHKFGRYSAHRNPLWFVLMLRREYPEIYAWAKANVGSDSKKRKGNGEWNDVP